MKTMLTMCFVLFSVCGRAQDSTEYKVYPYKSGAEGPIMLNVFSPANPGGPSPAIILFHGGSWIGGDRKQMNRQCAYFAERGMVAVTADYRLMSSANAPDVEQQFLRCIYDAKSAVRWVKKNAEMLGVDTARIVLGGGSAGGYLATMAAIDSDINDPADDKAMGTKPLALVLFNPAYPLDRPYVPDAPARASASAPPTIMFFGDQDEKWLPGGKKMHQALLGKKVHSECWIAPGQKHSFFNKAEWLKNTLLQSDQFLSDMRLLPREKIEKQTAMFPLEKAGQ